MKPLKFKSSDNDIPLIFKKRRGGVKLTKGEIREIRAGRKELRKRMRSEGFRKRSDFERTAADLGLYFDKTRFFPLWLFFKGRGLATLFIAGAALLAALMGMSVISEMRGHFTINLTDDLFREGFVLSDSIGFENPTSRLYSDPVFDAPCISITSIPEDIYMRDGSQNGKAYFAYTFYTRNEGETVIDYSYEIRINSESKNLSKATWVMLFEDDKMRFFAEETSQEGQEGSEMLPAAGVTTRGFLQRPMFEEAMYPDEQFETIHTTSGGVNFYRLIPYAFESEDVIVSGVVKGLQPMEVRKYTVVIWLEGDDPDCTNELIGGHVGAEVQFELLKSEMDGADTGRDSADGFWGAMQDLLDGLIPWEE